MGPMRNLTGIIEDIRAQTDEVTSITHRMRSANKRLTGGTGEAPTPLTNQGGTLSAIKEDEPPLMVKLTIVTEKLNQAMAALRAEISYFETLSETGQRAR